MGPRALFPDSYDYLKIAENITEGKGMILDQKYCAKRPPLYPLILSAHRIAFGPGILPIQFTQVILGTVSIWLVFIIARSIFAERTATFASFLVAIDPFLVYFTRLILYETVFVFLMLLLMRIIYLGGLNRGTYLPLIGGVINGFICLLHSGHLLFLIALLPCLILWGIKNRQKKVILLRSLSILLISSLLIVLPYTIRNRLLLGVWVPVSTQLGWALFDAFGPQAEGGTVPGRTDWLQEGLQDMDELEEDLNLRKRAWEEIKKDPLRALTLGLEKLRLFWGIFPHAPEYQAWYYILIAGLFAGPVISLGLWGIWKARHIKPAMFLLLAPILYYTALHVIFIGSIRYRMPIEPIFLIFSAYGLNTILSLREPGERSQSRS